MNKSYFKRREHCPACKKINTRTIYSCSFLESPIRELLASYYPEKVEFDYLDGATFILEECIDCGTIFQKEIPDDFLINKLYEEWIDPQEVFEWHLKTDFSFNLPYYAQEVMTMIAFFNMVPAKLKFFDFGMGWGKWCYMAKAFGCECYGAELLKYRLEYAQSQGIRVIEWDEIPNHRFDLINTEGVFEHLPEPLETLCHLKAALKPNGLIKISTPNGGDIKRRLRIEDWTAPKGSRNSLNPVHPLEHINCFNHFSIIRMGDIVGLEQVKIPMFLQWRYATNWNGLKRIIWHLTRPLYINVFSKGTYLFFRQKEIDEVRKHWK